MKCAIIQVVLSVEVQNGLQKLADKMQTNISGVIIHLFHMYLKSQSGSADCSHSEICRSEAATETSSSPTKAVRTEEQLTTAATAAADVASCSVETEPRVCSPVQEEPVEVLDSNCQPSTPLHPTDGAAVDSLNQDANVNEIMPVCETDNPDHTNDTEDWEQQQCAQCGFTCQGKKALDKHMKLRHLGVGRKGKYKCDLCGYGTNRTDQIRKHRRYHTGERPHTCDTCGKSFPGNSHLIKHMRKHTGERPFKCDTCGKSFTQVVHLTSHVRTHTGERPYVCDTCGSAFSCPRNLKSHRGVHTREIAIRCELCGAGFRAKSSYQTHMKFHLGVREYQCEVCPAQFYVSSHLNAHKRTHTGERPHSCTHCTAKFATPARLRNHVIACHTLEYKHRCSKCGKGFVKRIGMRKHVEKCFE